MGNEKWEMRNGNDVRVRVRGDINPKTPLLISLFPMSNTVHIHITTTPPLPSPTAPPGPTTSSALYSRT
jgi:hypothetical protein